MAYERYLQQNKIWLKIPDIPPKIERLVTELALSFLTTLSQRKPLKTLSDIDKRKNVD